MNSLRLLTTFSILLTTLALNSGCLVAPGTTPSVSAGFAVADRFIHRGMVQNDREVAQGSISSAFETKDGGGLTISSWGNVDLRNHTGDSWFADGHGGKFSEIDFSFQYDRQVGPLAMSGGFVTYIHPDANTFPNGARGSTTETFIQAQMEVAGFNPFARLNADFDEAEGVYVQLGVTRTDKIAGKIDTTLGVELGYSDKNMSDWNYGTKDAGFSDLRATGEASYYWEEQATTVFLGGGLSLVVDDDLRDWIDLLGIDRDVFWLTTGFRWNF